MLSSTFRAYALAVTAGMFCAPALSAGFPSKPITLVVPFAPGGPTDLSARLFGKVMSEQLGQPVIIDNRAGAGGTLGSAAVAKAPADGHTLLWGGTSSIVVAPALYDNLTYDPKTSFAPIGMAVRGPMLLVGNPKLQAQDLTQLLALAKREPLTVASAGNGSIGHLTAELFKHETGSDLLHVPYRGGAPALVDVMGGQVDLMFDTVTLLHPQISTGNVRPFAVMAESRYAALPDVPTFQEHTGKPLQAYSWFGLLAPAGTPPAVVDALSSALAAGARDADVIRQMAATGLEPVGGSAAAFRNDIDTDFAKWTAVVRQADVKPE